MMSREQAHHGREEEACLARDESWEWMDESLESEDEELVPSKRVASASTCVLEDSSDDELPTGRSKSSRVSNVEQGRKRKVSTIG